MGFYFSRGNLKLCKGMLVWNLPRLKTCPCAGACKEYCYEKKIERMRKHVLVSRNRNLEFSKTKEFVSEIIAYLKKRKEKIIRLHACGDFYSKTYFEKWKEIARQCEDKIFYTYTKSFGIFNVYEGLPNNFIVIQSYGSSMDNKIDKNNNTARVIDKEEELLPNEYLCPIKSPYFLKCGLDCDYCIKVDKQPKHVAFLKH